MNCKGLSSSVFESVCLRTLYVPQDEKAFTLSFLTIAFRSLKMKSMIHSFALILLIGLPFFGCASDKMEVSEGPMQDYPDWISTENNTYVDDEGQAIIYVVGAANAGRNPAMRWDSAKHNALLNLSRIMNTHVRGMFTSYAREAGDFYDEATLSSIRNDESVSRSLTEAYISGAVIVNKYLTENMKEAYVLMKLDLNNDMLQNMSDKAKYYVREHFAAKVKEETDKALEAMDKAAMELKKDLMPVPVEVSESTK